MPNKQPFPSDAAIRQASHAGCTAHTANGLETAAAGVDTTEANRRPIKARGNPFIQRLARRMAEAGITPNSISVASVVFAALGAVCLLVSPVGWGAIACAVGIQLRLLCNLIDGMVAVEGGRKTPTGALYNEVPDRVADSVLLVSLGYAVGVPWLGRLHRLRAGAGRLAGAGAELPGPHGQAAPHGPHDRRLPAVTPLRDHRTAAPGPDPDGPRCADHLWHAPEGDCRTAALIGWHAMWLGLL